MPTHQGTDTPMTKSKAVRSETRSRRPSDGIAAIMDEPLDVGAAQLALLRRMLSVLEVIQGELVAERERRDGLDKARATWAREQRAALDRLRAGP